MEVDVWRLDELSGVVLHVSFAVAVLGFGMPSIFHLMTFANGLCNSTAGDTGTCYKYSECKRKEGKANTACASGLGVCCICELFPTSILQLRASFHPWFSLGIGRRIRNLLVRGSCTDLLMLSPCFVEEFSARGLSLEDESNLRM